MPTNVDVRFTK